MVSFLLVVLNAGALCVARTDICAPAGSTSTGTVGPQGGQVTITPAAPMKALGAEFRAGTPVTVDVLPWWSSDKTAGAIVHVRGELTRETVISGAAVGGVVRIGQQQGKKGPIQLVEATDFKRGKLQAFTAGTIDVAPGMRIVGNVDIGGGSIEITSSQPVHAFGLDFSAGNVRVEQRSDAPTITGTLARAQDIGGVLVQGLVVATLEPGHPKFRNAILGRSTPLALLGLPAGDAPAGTAITSAPASITLRGPGPFTVCGVAVTQTPTVAGPAVMFELTGDPSMTMRAALVGTNVDVGGLHLSGPIAVRYDVATCKVRTVEGMLARDSVQDGLTFARKSAFTIGEQGKDRFVRGTLAQSAMVDGLSLIGAAMITVTPAGDVHLLEGTLAKPAPFEQWLLPARSHVQRFGVDSWSFEAPKGTTARATAEHRGERVDLVTEAHSDPSSTTFTLSRPHQPKGTKLAFNSLGIDHANGCLLGDVTTAQRFGIFVIPPGGNATVCAGVIVEAQSTYAVPALQVGNWFATTASAGAAGSSPPTNQIGSLAGPPAKSSGALAGYWIQINSLCQGPSGIPQPPPAQRWIWVDLKGQATSAPDRKVLGTSASKAGKACPAFPCCPP